MGANSSSRSDTSLLQDDEAERVNMERLDELCLLQILGYLRLPDQLALLQCEDRCYTLLGSLWRRTLNKIELNLLQVPLSCETFEFLLLNSAQNLRELKLNYLDKEKFELLVRHSFPSLQLLQVDALPPFFICRQRRRQLKQIMPKTRGQEVRICSTTQLIY